MAARKAIPQEKGAVPKCIQRSLFGEKPSRPWMMQNTNTGNSFLCR